MIDRVLRRPALSCVSRRAVLVALASRRTRLHVAKPSDKALSSQSEPEIATLTRIRPTFPSTSAPATVVIAGPGSAAGGAC